MTIPAVEKQEPAAIVSGLVVPVLMGLSLFLELNAEIQSALDAVLLAAGGVVVMSMVDWRKSLPLYTNLAKAVFSLIAGLGLHMNPSIQVGVFAVISAVVGWFVSTQVEAKPVAR